MQTKIKIEREMQTKIKIEREMQTKIKIESQRERELRDSIQLENNRVRAFRSFSCQEVTEWRLTAGLQRYPSSCLGRVLSDVLISVTS